MAPLINGVFQGICFALVALAAIAGPPWNLARLLILTQFRRQNPYNRQIFSSLSPIIPKNTVAHRAQTLASAVRDHRGEP